MGPRKCVIADDHSVVREGLRLLLETIPSLEVVAEAADGKAAVELVAQHEPDLIVIDLNMPGLNGTEAIPGIKRRKSDIKVVVLTLHKNDAYVRASFDAGADAYVLKDDTREELLSAVMRVLEGKNYVSPGVCNVLIDHYRGNSGSPERKSTSGADGASDRDGGRSFDASWLSLTLREREVLKLVAEGMRNKEIARFLSISPKTVEKHRYNVMRKLGLRNIADVTAYAIANELVTR
ncbi:MAG: response regulator [Gammaproteobacteria bacterium]